MSDLNSPSVAIAVGGAEEEKTTDATASAWHTTGARTGLALPDEREVQAFIRAENEKSYIPYEPARKRIEALVQALNTMKTKHKNAMREVAEKFEKVDSETRQQYNVYVAAIQKRAEEKFEAYKQRLAKLEAENADLANAVLEVEGKHKRELASYDAKKAQEYEELERSLSAKIELLQQELATIRSEKGEAEKAIELLEPAVRAREASIMSLEQEKRAIAEALKELASQTPANAVAAAEMEKVVQEKQAIEEQLKRANNAKAAAEKELVEAKQALSSLQNGQVANAAATAASMQGESVTVEAEPRTSAAPVPVSAGTSRSGASSEDLEKAESRAIAAEAQLAAISSQVKLLEGNRVEAVSRAEAIYQQLQKAIVDAVAASADANRSNDQNEEALLSAIEQAEEQLSAAQGRLNEATQGYEAVLARYSKQREEEENIRTRHKELKAEIKTWLSEFKEKNGREPTKDDKRAIKGTYVEYNQTSKAMKEYEVMNAEIAEEKAKVDAAHDEVQVKSMDLESIRHSARSATSNSFVQKPAAVATKQLTPVREGLEGILSLLRSTLDDAKPLDTSAVDTSGSASERETALIKEIQRLKEQIEELKKSRQAIAAGSASASSLKGSREDEAEADEGAAEEDEEDGEEEEEEEEGRESKAKRRLRQANQKIENLEARARAAEIELESTKAELEELHATIGNLKEELDAAQKEGKAAALRAAVAEAELAEAKGSAAEEDPAALEQLRKELEDAKTEAAAAKAGEGERKEKREQAASAAAEAKEAGAAKVFQAKLEREIKRAEAAEEELERVKSQLEKAKSAGGGGGRTKASARSTGGDGDSKALAVAQKKAREAEDKAKKLEKEMKEMRVKLNKMEKAQDEAVARASAGGKEVEKQLQVQERKWKDEEKKWNKKMEDAQKDADRKLNAIEKELAAAKAAAEAAEAQVKEIMGDRDKWRQEAEELRNATAELEQLRATANRVAELEKEVKEAAAQNEWLDHEYKKQVVWRKKLHNQIEAMKGNIRVFCRCRPMNSLEREGNYATCVDFPDEYTIDVATSKGPKEFVYDQCFGPGSTQDDVFEMTEPLVQSAFDGFNVCIFAYGQTGSGKTFTMTGNPTLPGITPRAISKLFDLIEENKDIAKTTVRCFMVELYLDSLNDLLLKAEAKGKKVKEEKLDIGMDKNTGMVMVSGAKIKDAYSAEEVMNLFSTGNEARHVGATRMNAESSRSHLLFTILVTVYNKQTKKTTHGKLTVVDLAGSERVDKTGAVAERLREAQYINKSLSALGNVISALSEGEKHIPYRDNKLTMLLRDSLGGTAKTLMFVNVSPSEYNGEETLSSLAYASRVKKIKNDAKKNADNAEITRLKKIIRDLKQGGTGEVADDDDDGGSNDGDEKVDE